LAGIATQPARRRRFCSRRCWARGIKRNPADRFWEKVIKAKECWIWIGSLNAGGYGQFAIRRQTPILAHRFSWQLANGPIPERAHILHSCDTPACVNPAHLFLGDQRANNADCTAKGRRPCGVKVPNAKLNEDSVRTIRHRYSSGCATVCQMAREYRTSHTTISNLLRGKAWRHVS
jgi:hypothetical protein